MQNYHEAAFEQVLDDVIEEARDYLSEDEIVAVLEAKLLSLKDERLDG